MLGHAAKETHVNLSTVALRIPESANVLVGQAHFIKVVLLLRGIYPVHVLDRVKACLEVCTVFCATANAVEVVIAESERGRGVLGVIDGERPRGVESRDDAQARRRLLRDLGYKL